MDTVRSLINTLYEEFETDPGSDFSGDYSSQTAYYKAEEENLVVVVPSDRQLFVDIDSAIGYAKFKRHFPLLQHFYVVTGTSENPSKSGNPERRHIVVSLEEPIDPEERLILQAFLGSDVKREFLGLQRVKSGDPVPTLFLERKPAGYKDHPVSLAPIDDLPF